MTRISNPPTAATAARVNASDLSNYYQDPNDEKLIFIMETNNLKYRIAA